ncbi:TPA: hypothetical protein ACH3X2_001715 [Trebouxia sp. C0005]
MAHFGTSGKKVQDSLCMWVGAKYNGYNNDGFLIQGVDEPGRFIQLKSKLATHVQKLQGLNYGACIKIKRLEVSAAGQTGSLSAGTNTVRAILLADSDITQTPPFHPLPLFRGTPVHKYNEFLNDSSTAVSGFDKEKVTLMVSIISITDKTDIGLVNVLVVDSKGDKTTVGFWEETMQKLAGPNALQPLHQAVAKAAAGQNEVFALKNIQVHTQHHHL